MDAGAAGFAGSTAASRNAIPSALPPPHWYEVKVTSRPLDVGKLAAPKTPPTWLMEEFVSRSFPLPCGSPVVEQLSRGSVALFPVAVRQATFVPLGGDGTVTVPAPSTVRLLKAFWNRMVPAAEAVCGAMAPPSVASREMVATSARTRGPRPVRLGMCVADARS